MKIPEGEKFLIPMKIRVEKIYITIKKFQKWLKIKLQKFSRGI